MIHRRPFSGSLLTLHVDLAHVRPKIWRRLVVPADVRLDMVHDILQVTFGWTNSHLHDFSVGEARFGMVDVEEEFLVVDECAAPLGAITEAGAKFIYRYDYGDDWEHIVHVEAISQNVEPPTVTCTGGARACPPEDCGGPPGYENMLAILRDPKHEEYAEMRTWVGRKYDPEKFDLAAVNKKLGPIEKRLARMLRVPRR